MIWKRTRHSHRQKQDPQQKAIKQGDLDMLEWAAAAGEIDLGYLDESGFCLWMAVSYTYYFRGEQKRQEQTERKGRRISILGIFQQGVQFVYGLVVGSFNSERYILMMDEQARQAEQVMKETGRIRVIVQDNGSAHTSKQVQAKWAEWESKGLYVFFLPKYCLEMNPIETEWHQLKTHELVGQMFEDELDLAYAVIDGVEDRAEAGGYSAERFRFPSTLVPSQSVT
ncbi:MAG: IS630 family transposase [Elainellaceae cyanobacterium]